LILELIILIEQFKSATKLLLALWDSVIVTVLILINEENSGKILLHW